MVEGKKTKLIVRFFKQFQDFMIITLIIAALISAIMAHIQKTNEYIDSLIIIFIVVLNAILGIIQESKAEKALEALKNMSAPITKVKRNGQIKQVPASQIVPGDYIIIEAGNYVPADARLVKTYHLKVEESSLTGENIPVQKNENIILDKSIGIGDMKNMVFASTTIVHGHAEAIVTETGMNTKVGKIATMIMSNEAPETPLQQKLGEIGKKLGLIALGICFLIFIIGIIKKNPVDEIFMTSIGLAVAAIPEGLPAIVTIMLSIGVTKMARKNAIIRKLPAVETLGSSNIIASDKTGTLTQNKMKVEKIFINNKLQKIQEINLNNVKDLVCYSMLCNNTEISNDKKLTGDPTETALVDMAFELGIDTNIYNKYPRAYELPFDSERKLMTTINKHNNKYKVITKGAPDVLIKRCNRYCRNGEVYNLDHNEMQAIIKNNEEMANNALRVIAVAYKEIQSKPNKIDLTIENDLIFVRIDRNDRST